MKLTWDRDHDVAYLHLTASGESRSLASEPHGDDVVLDYNPDGRLVGIEFLNASRTLLPTFLVHLAAKGEIRLE